MTANNIFLGVRPTEIWVGGIRMAYIKDISLEAWEIETHFEREARGRNCNSLIILAFKNIPWKTLCQENLFWQAFILIYWISAGWSLTLCLPPQNFTVLNTCGFAFAGRKGKREKISCKGRFFFPLVSLPTAIHGGGCLSNYLPCEFESKEK